MAGGVGNLTVGLNLDYAQYTAGLTKAQAQAQQFATNFKASFAGNLAAGFTRDIIRGLAQIPGAFKDAIAGAIDAADHLNDLSKKTGIAADTLGGIGFAAKQAGGDLESAAAGIGKLNKSIAEAAAGGKEAAEGFAVIGVAVKDASGATKNADQVLSEVADKFASYADGPEKAALALRLFGKAGADMIPLLNDGGAALQGNIDYFKRYSGVTVETAKAADQFNDTLEKISLLTKAFATTIASELLGPLQAVAQRFLEAKESGNGFGSIASFLKGAFIGLAEAASFVVESLAAMSARLDGLIQKAGAFREALPALTGNVALDSFNAARALASDDVQKQFAQIQKIQDEGVKAAQTRHDRLVAALNFTDDPRNFSNEGRNSIRRPKPAPRLPSSGSGAPLDDPAKRLFDNQLKALDAQIEAERDLLQFRNHVLEIGNEQGLVSFKTFFEARQTLAQDALQSQQSIIDQELALAEKRKATLPRGGKEQEAVEGKIEELIRRRAALETAAGRAAVEIAAQQTQAQKALAEAFAGVSAQVLDLQENFAAAAAIKFDLQFDALKRTFTANGNEAGKEAIATLRAAAIAQGAFQKAALDSTRTLDDLQRTEDRIAISVQTGARGSIDALIAEGEARRKIIPALEAQVAGAGGDRQGGAAGRDAGRGRPGRQGRRRAHRPRAAEGVGRSGRRVDQQGPRANFNSALDDFVTGTKTASEAFKSFAKSVLNDILKLGSKSITESLFGGSGGIGGFISDIIKNQGGAGGGLFGGSGIGSFITGIVPAGTGDSASSEPTADAVSAITKLFSDTGASASKAAESAASTAAATAVTALATAATAATTALTSLAATQAVSTAGDAASSAGDIASLFSDFSGFFATGGDIKPGQWGVVGENGPELAFGGNAGKSIQPAVVSAPARVNNITVNVPSGAPREYGMQVGADVARQLAIADRRNN
jgi:hypothetical protein